MYDRELRKLALVSRVGLIYRAPDGVLTALSDVPEDNPLYVCASLREKMLHGADSQEMPYIYRDSFEVYFACIKAPDGHYLIGPMSSLPQSAVVTRSFYYSYDMKGSDYPTLRTYTIQQILYIVELFAEGLTGKTYEETELLFLNKIAQKGTALHEREQALFSLSEDDANEDSNTWRHSYRQERSMLDAVREGRVEDALRISREMDEDAGRLSSHGLSHWKNLAIVAITLTSRAAIDGGLSPDTAYRISGYYIQKCDACLTGTQACGMRDYAIRDITTRVRDKLTKAHTSNYTETCKTYIAKHYREKLYLDDIAEHLGISPTYLSRLFKKDTGIRLQDYINLVRIDRASNMLKYSELSLSEIAEYVHFPSQSDFGKIFRQQMHMTPKEYRDRYKAAEYTEKKHNPQN